MGSKREEERNEKIIRGLMKLPPNRRCINCNSLGPQYVCTNFWTFVCMTCSGIHREFTHRVKSVSMAKFTSQEVDAIQNGGNQRARETYLKNWDLERQRLPDSSNVDKIREFINSVYVNRRYAGGKTVEKPPRDVQNLRSHEAETRRASSYHSFSQSPPYDYQYEDRRHGKHTAVLTRKPGSDRGLYAGKISSFVYSPGRSSEQDDRFANEGSVSRFSDYSVSSGGDPSKSGTVSPNFQKDIGFNSPPIQHPEEGYQRDAHSIPRPKRTTSSGSIGSFDSNSMCLRSYNSFADAISEPEQATGAYQDNIFPKSSAPVNYGGIDLFQAPVFAEPNYSAAAPIDLFQLPAMSSTPPVDMVQPSLIFPAPSTSLHQTPQTAPSSSLDFFAGIGPQPSTSTLDSKSPVVLNPKNEGWATFDTHPPAQSIRRTESLPPSLMPSDGRPSGNLDKFSSLNGSMQWPPFKNSSDLVPTPSLSNEWHDGLHSVQVLGTATNTQSWNAFCDSIGNLTLENDVQSSEPQVAVYKPSSTIDQNLSLNVLERCTKDVFQRAGGPTDPSVPSRAPMLPLMGKTEPHVADRKSTNPFDLPYDYDLEQRNTQFLNISSLQAALPNAQIPSTFLGGVAEPWFPQNPVTPYIPAPQGGLAYMTAQAPGSQLSNVPTQGPVASIGGNPFA
ncbi:ArfGap domain-containing protein [Cephalotus follicularis]|uniref:ArfGap domain-containing protein n=1 Tax=Cephalotus follicularis TaxID=3775 RepID=A0A1Q3D546_CEPFO|nr:ArfGap domain-containing protein [Cephalotus follicularis]